jgi:hypothetical protein
MVNRTCRSWRPWLTWVGHPSGSRTVSTPGRVIAGALGGQDAEAETSFRQALDVARRQQAKSWEPRTAMSLRCLWQRQGKGDDARQVLAEVYSWFT